MYWTKNPQNWPQVHNILTDFWTWTPKLGSATSFSPSLPHEAFLWSTWRRSHNSTFWQFHPAANFYGFSQSIPRPSANISILLLLDSFHQIENFKWGLSIRTFLVEREIWKIRKYRWFMKSFLIWFGYEPIFCNFCFKLLILQWNRFKSFSIKWFFNSD
jgi:hypothetical protein